MIYRFKLVSDEVNNFSREIEIDSEATFLQLRNTILDSVGYSKDELDSFFLCDDDWQREEEITLEDMGSSSDQDIWLMEATPIAELVEEEGQKLAFVFDYLTERSFFMELKEVIPGRNLIDPICTVKRGTPPPQVIDMNEFDNRVDQAVAKMNDSDLDADLFDQSGFNEDEIAEGFDEMDM